MLSIVQREINSLKRGDVDEHMVKSRISVSRCTMSQANLASANCWTSVAHSGERRCFGHLSDGSHSVDGGYLGR